MAGYPTTKNRHSSVCKPRLCQTPAAHASKAARFYISPCPPHPPSFFLVFGRVGPPKGPHHENIRIFFSGGGEQSRETQGGSNKVHHWRKRRASAEANRCTHGNCIGRWSGSAVSAGSTVVNIASKWLERHGTCNGNGWDNYKHYQMYVHWGWDSVGDLTTYIQPGPSYCARVHAKGFFCFFFGPASWLELLCSWPKIGQVFFWGGVFLVTFFFAVLGLAASLAVWTGQYLTKVQSGRTGHFERVRARCEMSMKCQEAAASVQRTASLGPYCSEAYRRIGCRPPIGKQKDRHCDPMCKT